MKEVGQNKKARFNYDIIDTFEAGIELTGWEVKSARMHRANLSDAYASVNADRQVYLYNLHIPEYKMATTEKQEPKRLRKLLLHRKQIDRVAGILNKGGVSLIPISIYFNNKGWLKVQLGIGRGKKIIDKRESIKEREWNREKSRVLKKQI